MCWWMSLSSQDSCHVTEKAFPLKHICACSIAEMLECTSLMAFVGAGKSFIADLSAALG